MQCYLARHAFDQVYYYYYFLLLQKQLSILEEPQVDPFQASESDIEDAYERDQRLDPDEEDEDEDVDIC